ncbi:MAG: hypothetical protein ACPG4K_00800 [Haloferula sp.]
MTRYAPILALACSLSVHAQSDPSEPSDLLRLEDGELAGHFGGINGDGNVLWNRDDGIDTMEFKQDKIRQIVLRGGGNLEPKPDTSHILLTNGDRLPAKIVAMDRENITLDTPMAGKLVIPLDAVVSMHPNPFGGRLLYAGPFSEDGWEIRSSQPDEDEEEEGEEEEEPEENQEEEKAAAWRHVGAKWYFTGGRDALRRQVGLTDKSALRFTLEWRSRPPIAIALNADFAERPEPKEAEEEENEEEEKPRAFRRVSSSSNYAKYFGNSLVLTLRSSYAQLLHCGYDEDGNEFSDQIRPSSSSVRVEDSGSADFELRSNREAGTITLFVNGKFATQWNLEKKFEDDIAYPTGGGIGFSTMGSDTPARISDIIVAEWNGMPDSARSFESEEADTILLTNGTDRFAGEIQSIEGGILKVKSAYAELEIPVEEVAQVRFAGREIEEDDSLEQGLQVHFQPLGTLSGKAGKTAGDALRLESPLLGEIKVDLDSAVLLEFDSGQGFLNYWDEDL